MGKDSEKSVLQSKYESLIADDDVSKILDVIGATTLSDPDDVEMLLRALNESGNSFDYLCRRFGKKVGHSTQIVKLTMKSAQNVYRSRDWSTIASRDPQMI